MNTSTKPTVRAIAALVLMLVCFVGVISVSEANATSRTFNANSYIFSSDSCWQPNNDPNAVAGAAYCDTNKNDQSEFQVYGLLYSLLDTGDQPDKCINNDGSTPQQKALFGYCKQIKVYWIIDSTKTDPQAADMTLSDSTATATKPIITIYNSTKDTTKPAPINAYTTKANSGTATSISYKGGPFVIDVNDMTATEFAAIKAKFPAVKMHQANIAFSGNVDKVLIGKPPKIAVLSEGNSDILEDYIRAAGQFAWKGVVFQYVGAREIMAGCLRSPIPATCSAKRPDIVAPFQLLWAPHWEIGNKWSGESANPTAADQTTVVAEIRKFLEAGNSGFFECASIGSLESTHSSNDIGMSIAAGVGGFLVSKDSASPRIENNKGCFDNNNCNSGYLKFEKVPFWLTQCGGWNYKPTSGLVDSMRPMSSYSYLTTQTTDSSTTTDDDRFVGTQLTRFVHDDPTKLNSSYSAGTSGYYVYDYLLGGRINGSPTQGYVVFFPGHKYISCSNNTTYTDPPSRTFDMLFSDDIPATGTISVELVHEKCTHGTNCPTVSYNMTTKTGTKSSDSWASLSAEFAAFDAGNNRLEGLVVTSAFDDNTTTTSQLANSSTLKISDLYVTFTSNSGVIKLLNVIDMTQGGKRMSLCAPNATYTTTPVRCTTTTTPTTYPETTFSLRFDSDVSAHPTKDTVTIKLNVSGGSVSATFNTRTNTCTGTGQVCSSTYSTVLTLDTSAATYDAGSFTLSNIKIKRGSTCGAIGLTDVQVSGDMSSPPKLVQVYNDTGNEQMCAPGTSLPSNCTDVLPAGPITGISSEIRFNNALTSTSTVGLTLAYTWTDLVNGATGTGTLAASWANAANPKSVAISDSYMTIDMSSATLTNTSKYLSGIKLINLDSTKSVSITNVSISLNTPSNTLLKYCDSTNNSSCTTPIVCWGSSCAGSTINNATLTKAPSSAYQVKDGTNPPPAAPTWGYSLGAGVCSLYISPYLSTCGIQWGSSNTCGIKYVLNTFLALKYQSTSNEFSKTQPIVKDNIMYKASYDYPTYRGHLRMIKVPTDTSSSSITVWDAAAAVPSAGTSSFPSAPLSAKDTTSSRYIFTNQPGAITHVNFDETSATTLASNLVAASTNEAKVIINTVRGRKNASTSDVYNSTSTCSTGTDGLADTSGCDEDTKRLWAIENSTPAMKTKSKFVESTATAVTSSAISLGRDRRDRILFAGADDGMLHAFWGGSYDSVSAVAGDSTTWYPDNASGWGTGKEIWAYIPSSLLSNMKNQPFNPDPSNESTFEPKVSVDGSPALGDFLIQNASTGIWEWRTRLVGTAMVRSENKGIVFSLDVTDPYTPQLLWESTYNVATDSSCSGTSKNCNMGTSNGVAIGTAEIGDKLKDYVFLTSSWINKKKVALSGSTPVVDSNNEYTYVECAAGDTGACVYGVSAFALDMDTGKVMWKRDLPYSGDATNINVTPAAPALMDRDNNGSYDYVVFGDMQGRLWALRTTDGKNLTDKFDSTNHVSIPVYQIHVLDSSGMDTTTLAGAKEPIGAPVAVYRDYVVLGTGGADYASNGSATDAQKYRVEVIRLTLTGGVKDNNQTVVLTGYTNSTPPKGNEKVWGKPLITSDLKVFVGTARSYYSSQTVSTLQSDGRILAIDLRVTNDASKGISNVIVVGGTTNQWQSGGFVGGLDIDRKHIYAVALTKTVNSTGGSTDTLQIGAEDFTKARSTANPYKVLWWRKL